ncbi:hypothetical protein M9Y10_043640 [Tritrichomonas musculus]|uniref:Copine C-terminal domain-containing protein n=1 Tax=Tritrichomonas musculus TaxID=1915356 RepID=A0ABR2K1D6_9EUKA
MMDYFSCDLYRKSSAYKSFVSHINSTRPLRVGQFQSNTSHPRRSHSTKEKFLSKPTDYQTVFNLHFESDSIPSDGVNTQDFLCVMSVFGKGGWEKYARTEANFSYFSRRWIQPITVLGSNKLLRFELYQVTSDLYSLRHQKYIGDCEAELKDILSKDIFQIDIRLSYEFTRLARGSNLTSTPRLIIKHRKLEKNRKGSAFFKMTYENQIKLPKLSFKPSHYFEIEIVENNILVYRSNVVKLNPKFISVFDTVDFNLQLHFGSLTTPVRFKLHEVSKADRVLFEFETTVECLMQMSTMKYPIGNNQGFVIGEFDIHFIGENSKSKIDDLKINGISFQSIFAFDFSDGKKVCDSFRMALTEVYDSLNGIAQLKPYTAFGFGCFSEKHNVFTFNNSITFKTMKKLFVSYRDCLLKIEKTPKESKLTPVIKRAKRIAMDKWNESETFSIVSIFTTGLNIVDFDESIDAMMNCEQYPIIFLIITLNSVKNKFTSLTSKCKSQYLHSLANIEEPTSDLQDSPNSRQILEVVFFGSAIMNHPSNLQNVKKSVSKMVQDWGGIDHSLLNQRAQSYNNLPIGKLPASTSFDNLSGIVTNHSNKSLLTTSSKSYLELNKLSELNKTTSPSFTATETETETEPALESDNEVEVYESRNSLDKEYDSNLKKEKENIPVTNSQAENENKDDNLDENKEEKEDQNNADVDKNENTNNKDNEGKIEKLDDEKETKDIIDDENERHDEEESKENLNCNDIQEYNYDQNNKENTNNNQKENEDPDQNNDLLNENENEYKIENNDPASPNHERQPKVHFSNVEKT